METLPPWWTNGTVAWAVLIPLAVLVLLWLMRHWLLVPASSSGSLGRWPLALEPGKTGPFALVQREDALVYRNRLREQTAHRLVPVLDVLCEQMEQSLAEAGFNDLQHNSLAHFQHANKGFDLASDDQLPIRNTPFQVRLQLDVQQSQDLVRVSAMHPDAICEALSNRRLADTEEIRSFLQSTGLLTRMCRGDVAENGTRRSSSGGGSNTNSNSNDGRAYQQEENTGAEVEYAVHPNLLPSLQYLSTHVRPHGHVRSLKALAAAQLFASNEALYAVGLHRLRDPDHLERAFEARFQRVQAVRHFLANDYASSQTVERVYAQAGRSHANDNNTLAAPADVRQLLDTETQLGELVDYLANMTKCVNCFRVAESACHNDCWCPLLPLCIHCVTPPSDKALFCQIGSHLGCEECFPRLWYCSTCTNRGCTQCMWEGNRCSFFNSCCGISECTPCSRGLTESSQGIDAEPLLVPCHNCERPVCITKCSVTCRRCKNRYGRCCMYSIMNLPMSVDLIVLHEMQDSFLCLRCDPNQDCSRKLDQDERLASLQAKDQ